MADGRDRATGTCSVRASFPWIELFRCFQVALDPRKLLAAAAGILAVSVGWYIRLIINLSLLKIYSF